ncbi:hypothetical protein GQ53DRAFT_363966 [Thozetella sp. PMI_491]|nr:hypothetical protein GQ53DRAFT_363966 [Thozetella sp. PMI_491]
MEVSLQSVGSVLRPWAFQVSAGVAIVIIVLAGFWLKQKRPVANHPHVLDFPPQRRHVLESYSLGSEVVFGKTESKGNDVPPEILRRNALPSAKTVDLTKGTPSSRRNIYTPTGFSLQDVKELGKFPDYAKLSGVRHPNPCGPEFDINKAVFRPFRPFRWKYHQHMALMKYEPDYWVELEQNYFQAMEARQELLKTHGDRIFFHIPGSELACRELMEMLLQFVCKRYPQYFALSGMTLTNRLLNTETDLATVHPLRVIFDNIPEDYALMLRNEEDGFYYLRAAMVCSSVGWDIAQHIGSPLRAIHTEVPDASKMAMSMDRYFSKMPTDQPIQRCSWSIEDYEVLFSSPEVAKDWHRSAFANNPDDLRPEHLKLRCDLQTLRRLPLSGAIVFNFKAVFTPFEELEDEPYVPALLHTILKEGKENLITYKTVERPRQVAMQTLEAWAKEQVRQGVVPEDWEVRTLDESPFYPGWEERWHARQGF